ncbi:hypothetical protein [Proteiniclasticum sp. QWL-01]|uniref:hypothetical protein n=1 Tax=Proteiniclasticum sp. QWL-01 TaxID=3036945 RepID=UPI00240F5C66|nr:hypothetical protein [Proteiniclasticum sp. QWL-01]WFF72658.1 hypothetical protein P6M73_15520 [Proteiniclasticum sp. QWL-01]
MHRDDGFPDFFPDECPPDCANFDFKDMKVFRISNEENEVTMKSFRSYFQDKIPLKHPDNLYRNYAVSVFEDLQGLHHSYEASGILRKSYPSKIILEGTLKEKSGATLKKGNNSHVSWWIKHDYDPTREFEFLKEV